MYLEDCYTSSVSKEEDHYIIIDYSGGISGQGPVVFLFTLKSLHIKNLMCQSLIIVFVLLSVISIGFVFTMFVVVTPPPPDDPKCGGWASFDHLTGLKTDH